MRTFLIRSIVLGLGLFALYLPTAAHAQATRTWISGVGDDANPCSRTAPCKTFAGAISKTATAGEINCLDPGGFGALTITKAISIICGTAGDAGVLVSGTNGFTVAAGASDLVYLEGLDFEGLNSSLSGVQINSAGEVHIVNSIIRGFNTAGINVTTSNSSGGTVVDVIDTIIADNPGEGIFIKPTGGNLRGFVDRTRIINNTGDGLFVNSNATSGSIKIAVRDSESANNGLNGIGVAANGQVGQIQIDSTTVSNNATGLAATGSTAIIRFTRSTVFANGTGATQTTGGSVLSYSTNSVDGNGTPGTFTTTPQQ